MATGSQDPGYYAVMLVLELRETMALLWLYDGGLGGGLECDGGVLE